MPAPALPTQPPRRRPIDWTSLLLTEPTPAPAWLKLAVYFAELVAWHMLLPKLMLTLNALVQATRQIVWLWLVDGYGGSAAPPAGFTFLWSNLESRGAALGLAGAEIAAAIAAHRLIRRSFKPAEIAEVARHALRMVVLLTVPALMILSVPEYFVLPKQADWVIAATLAAMLGAVIILPTLLSRRGTTAPRRMIRWRPSCPECGQSIRRAALPRCTECGSPFAGDARRDRRWAVQRVALDRGRSAWSATRLVRTAVHALLLPCDFADRLAVPDRFRRASAFGAASVLSAMLLAIPLPAIFAIAWFIFEFLAFTPPEPIDYRFILLNALTLTGIVWIVIILSVPVSCALFIALWPFPNIHARAVALKWSCCSMVILPLLLSLGWCALIYIETRLTMGAGGVPAFHQWLQQNRIFAPTIFAAAYALYWGLGMQRNRYLHQRGRPLGLAFSIAFLLTWWFLCTWLIPIGYFWSAA
ncbi:MAG: hypothetical protein SF069_00800 [Phycisphaerae bacterium]|nr:hypothetical protein [Phycisphaerae bacterium]